MDPYVVSRIGAVTIQRVLPETSNQNSDHDASFPPHGVSNDPAETEMGKGGYLSESPKDPTDERMEVDENKQESSETGIKKVSSDSTALEGIRTEFEAPSNGRVETEGAEAVQMQGMETEPTPELGLDMEAQRNVGPRSEDYQMVANEGDKNEFSIPSEGAIDSRTSGGGEEEESGDDSSKLNKADNVISSLTQNNIRNLNSDDINKKLGRFGFSVSVSEVNKPSTQSSPLSDQIQTDADEQEDCGVNEFSDDKGIKSIETLVSSLSEPTNQFQALNSNVELLNELDFKKEIFSDGLDSETVGSEIMDKPNTNGEEEQKMDVRDEDKGAGGAEGDEDEESEDDDDKEGDDDGGDEKDPDDKDGVKKKKKRSKKKKEKKAKKSGKDGDESSSSGSDSDSEKKKRKAGVLNMRRNIREVMDETQLDESTLNAQRQEMERLRRVQEQQRIIREVQRQIAINRQQTKTQTRVISLLQGGSSSKTTVTSSSSSKPNTVVVKVSSGSGSTQIVNKKVLDLLKNQKGSAENASDLKVPAIPRTLNKPHMVTPSVSIAPIQVKSTAVSTSPVEDFSDDENVARAAVALKKKAATGKKDVVTISSSGSEDDCIVISEPSAGEESEVEDDPTNSGMHTNDLYNVPDDQGRVLINVGHPETEPDVFLSPQIARIIKPHQIGGVRFLFDNLVESLERYKTSSGFGCILAHSMGLGKTLQVVSFCDVFLRYTGGKSVLCIMPINTLQNWVAEFNHWLPMDPTNSPLAEDGEVRPRDFQIFILNDFQKSLAARAKVIHEWNKEGGVLMIGYELYRQLSLKKPRKPRNKKQKEEEIPDEKAKPLLEEIYEALVKPGPDLVICDEGHRIKNSHASISHALKQIRSKRRVVLTGYPLQNNLLEYWCMVDFVRPNYLGSKTEFSNMFERPIQNGQCVDSTPQDVRLMRYRAHVLHSLLEGFVQRRSHAVLQQALPQKEEFVLLVRMTDFQRKLYETFMNEVVRVKAVPNPLKAFAVCCKIWNHPDILYNFLKKKEEVDLDLVEAAACIGAPGAVAGSVPPTPPTPTAKGGKRSRAKDPSTAAAKKEKKPRKGSKAAIEAAEKSPAVATVMPNMSNNPTTNDPSMPPFNYNSNSAGPDSNDPFNSNSNYANSNRYDGYGQQPFPGHMGPNYNNPSQQPYNSFNYNQTNYPSQSNLPPSQQPNQQNQQQQSYPYSGYPDQQNYWQDNSNLYPNNPDPNSGMNYYGGSNNSFYNQNNSNFNTPNNLYNQPNYPYGGNDSSSTSGNLPGPNSAATVPPLPNVGNTLGDTNSNLNAVNSKDNSNFSCLSNPPSVPNYNNVSDNVHNIVNNNLGLGNLPNSINPVDSLMNPSLAPNNCEASKNSGNYHGLPCPDYSGNSMYQNMGSSQFTTNSDQNSGNMGSSNMMGSMLNDSAVSTVTNPASSSNLMSDSFNSMTPYGNPQYPGDMYGKSNNYPNSGSFPPHQMNAQQNIPNAQQNMPNAQQNVPNAPQNIPNAQQNASQSMPYNHLAQNQSDFGPPLKKEGDTSMFPNADSSLSGLNYPFKTESKDDIKDPSSFPLLPPSKEELKSEIKDEIKEESKTDVQVKEKEEESVTADDAKKDDLKGESSALVDASMKDASSLTKPSFENPASKKEDPGIPYDWAIKLLEDYVPGAIEASPKMAIFFSIVQDSILMKDRILVFSQSLFTLNLIEDFLQKNFIPGTETYWAKNWSYYRLDGSTTASEREKLINEFNANDQVHMFLVSTRAGSLGINLVGANRVIVFDASWNPCHDTQAVCRVYRYGQQKPCFVYRLVMDNCLEKKIYDRQINKQGMADRVVDECNPDAHLSIKEVANLCWDNDEDSAVQDFSDCKDKYTDVIIHRILDSFSQFLSKAPFEHESLLVDRKEKKLSTAEKRLAKRSYELEKQANTRPTYNFVGNQQGLQIRSLNKPMASVRPVQSEMNSFGKDSNSKWIPAEVWQKQGMSAQEMTLPLDVVIPTNSADRSSIVLNAGQKVMVLKSPKGIYMQLENGKIIAIRTAYKVGAGGGANKGTEKKMFTGQTQSRQVPLNRPQFDRGVRGLEGRREISVSPIRGRGTAVPGLLRNNSSISITPRTIPAARNVSPNSKPNGSLMRLLGPKSRTTNVRLPVIKDSNVSVTITKRNPAVSSASSSSSSFSTPPSAEQLERDSSYHSRLESKTKQMESASGQKVMNADFSDNLSQSPSSNSSSSLLNQPVEKDVKSVGTESNPSDFKESLNTSTSTNTSSSPDSMYSDPARFASDAKSGDYKQTDKMYSEPMRPRIDIKSPEYKQPEKAYHEPTRPRIDMKTHDYKHTSEHVRHKIDIRSPEFNKADQSRLMMDLSPSDYKQMDKMYNEPMRPKVDIKSPEYKQMDRSYNEPMRPRLEMKSSEYKQADKPFNEPMRLKADPKTSDYKPLDKMKNLMYSQNQATFTPAAPISDRLSMPQSGDKSKFPSLPPNISFGPANSSQKNYRPTSHQRSSTPMNSSYHGDANRMPEMPVETSSNFKKPNTSPFNPSGFSSSVSSDLQQMPQQFKNTPPYQSLEKTSHTKDSAFQNLKQRGSISIIPMDKSSKAQQSSLHPPSQSPMSGSSTNSASQIPLNSNEYDYRSNIDSGVEPFSSPAYRSDYYSNFSQQPVSSAPSPSPQMHSIYSNPTERSGAQSLPSSYDMYQQPYSAAPNVGSSGYSSSSYNSASYESPVVNQQMNQQQMYSAFHRPEPLYPAAPAPAPTSSYPNPPNPYQYNSYYPPYGSPASDNSNLQNLQRPQ